MAANSKKRSYINPNADYGDFNQQKINTLQSIIGDQIPQFILQKLLSEHKGNLDRAVDDFFSNPHKYDASKWKQDTITSMLKNTSKVQQSIQTIQHRYYIGDTIVTGWSTYTGKCPLKQGDAIIIGRNSAAKLSESIKRSRFTTPAKQNTIVRFSTQSGSEIGRLPRDTAKFVSKLMDLQIAEFTATLVYCDSELKTGDEILLHMKCYFLKNAFNSEYSSSNSLNQIRRRQMMMMDETTLNERNLALLSLIRTLGLKPTRSALRNNKCNNNNEDNDDTVLDRIAQSISTMKPNTTTDDSNNGGEEGDGSDDENKELTDGQLDTLYDKAQLFDAQITPVSEPDTMALSLKPYQQRALAWMISKESFESDEDDTNSLQIHPLWEEYNFPTDPSDDTTIDDRKKHFYFNPYNGQLDLMGLGKTIEMLSLIHANRYNPDEMSPPPNGTNKSPTTLIVCPTSLLAQWRDEVIRGSVPGSMKVEVYYGGSRTSDLQQQFCVWDGTAPDVLVTTYGVIMFESNRSESTLADIEFWRIVLDEAHHIKNRMSKTAKACYTLKSTRRWALTGTPIQNKLEDLFSLVRFLKHEPWGNYTFWKTFITIPFENMNPQALTTVKSVLEPLVLRRTKNMRDNNGDPIVPLPSKQINIEYLTLSPSEQDIYESIYKDSKTKFSDFCSAGTALRNYMSILQLLTRLRQTTCHPYLVLRKGPNNSNNHSEDYITNDNGRISIEALIEKYDNSTMNSLTSDITDNNDNGNSSTVDMDIDKKMGNESRSYGSTVLQNILNQQKGSSSLKHNDAEENAIPEECPVCFEPMECVIMLPCMHMACRPCVMEYLQKKENQGLQGDCPICRHGPIQEKDLLEITKQQTETEFSLPTLGVRRAVGGYKSSTKINALLQHLKKNIKNGEQTVVFSQFTGFLDLIGVDLKLHNIQYIRFDGTMNQAQREEALAKFKNSNGRDVGDEKIMVMLISLRAGGVGLNLTCASQVIMMDPWWNFAVESQAIDRVHRLGQVKNVVVTRFIIKDSVEEQILSIQNRKHALMNELYVSKDEQKAKHLQELQLLFKR
ncbi:SNF2 family N-terminal domain-containing protein [Cunninghamella echinulata]|nr:SNF2 family N-terminal domain-containing protein [Cunninghamella echinulata]